MTWFRCGGSGISAALKSQMNNVLNKKFGTSIDYPPNSWPDDVNLMGPLPEGTSTGPIASISDGADRVPIKSWIVNIEPNLTGNSAIECIQDGINLFNEDWEVGGLNDTTGLPNSDTNKIRSKTFSNIKGGVTIYIKAPQPIRVLFYKADETFISETSNIRNNTFTVPSDAELFKIRGTVDYGTTYNDDISINFPSTDTEYHSHVAPTVSTVNLGQTIYGGSADVVNGTGTETYIRKDMGDLSWTRVQYQSSGIYAFRYISTDKKNGAFNLMAEGYTLATSGHGWGVNMEDMTIVGQTGTGYIFIRDDRYTTEEDFIEAINHKMVCYELSEPTDFTFTPITPTPETALGTNNFWADTGDSTVVYRRDIDLALQALSGSRGLMMASRPVAQMVGEESDPDQVNELVEDNETEQEDENNAR